LENQNVEAVEVDKIAAVFSFVVGEVVNVVRGDAKVGVDGVTDNLEVVVLAT
jgi:hypothetical protein